MKASRKKAQRRYTSVEQFAEDIRRKPGRRFRSFSTFSRGLTALPHFEICQAGPIKAVVLGAGQRQRRAVLMVGLGIHDAGRGASHKAGGF